MQLDDQFGRLIDRLSQYSSLAAETLVISMLENHGQAKTVKAEEMQEQKKRKAKFGTKTGKRVHRSTTPYDT